MLKKTLRMLKRYLKEQRDRKVKWEMGSGKWEVGSEIKRITIQELPISK
jgi:hypothetical protein